jgi:hypothetical protein
MMSRLIAAVDNSLSSQSFLLMTAWPGSD